MAQRETSISIEGAFQFGDIYRVRETYNRAESTLYAPKVTLRDVIQAKKLESMYMEEQLFEEDGPVYLVRMEAISNDGRDRIWYSYLTDTGLVQRVYFSLD